MATKLLLLHDVEDLGRSGDVVSVKPGYARNFLLPKQHAVVASGQALRMQERLQEERKKKAVEDQALAEETAKKIEGVTLSTTVKVDQDGHMYGSVAITDVLRLFNEQQKLQLEKKSVQLPHPIKEIGVHTIQVKLQEGVTAKFTLKVISETAEVDVPIVEETPEEAEAEEPAPAE